MNIPEIIGNSNTGISRIALSTPALNHTHNNSAPQKIPTDKSKANKEKKLCEMKAMYLDGCKVESNERIRQQLHENYLSAQGL